MTTPLQAVYVAFATELAKAQILARIRQGTMPDTVDSFGDLHDYCDANMLGFCGDWDEADMELIAPRQGEEDQEFFPHAFSALVDKIQQRVHYWVRAGLHRRPQPVLQYRDMTHEQRVQWGHAEHAARVKDLEREAAGEDGRDKIVTAIQLATARRRDIGATHMQAEGMLIAAGRERRAKCNVPL